MSEENHCGDELNQAAMDESPAQAPTATQVWPAPSKVQFGKSSIFQAGSWIQEKSFAPGAGEFPGAGDDAAGGAAEISSYCYFHFIIAAAAYMLVVIVYVLNSMIVVNV